MSWFDLLLQWSGKRQQAALVHVETSILVATDDVEGERRAVPGRVFVGHHELEDAAAERLALLQETRLVSSLLSSLGKVWENSSCSQPSDRKFNVAVRGDGLPISSP